MKVIKAPEQIVFSTSTLFLAGSIEMGKAVDWQTQVTNALVDKEVTIFNPRRDDWDSSWEQKITNLKFKEQVVWELMALEWSDVIVMYFDPATMSPISLLELGLYARDPFSMTRMIVCCPEGFWRKGNVDIVCQRYGVRQVETLEELIEAVREEFNG